MSTVMQAWGRAADRSATLRFVDVNLRGAGQVMFQDNPLTGLLFLIGILWGGIASGAMMVTVGCLVGLVTSTCVAIWLDVDHPGLRSGLYGYNGILVGAALATFLASSPLLWVYLIFGAGVSTVIMLAISNVAKTWGLSALTAPFVLTTLIFLMATYNFPNLGTTRLPHAALHTGNRPSGLPLTLADFFPSVFTGISQVFLVQNVMTGVIFLLGLAVSSVSAASFALAASVVAVAVASQLGVDSTLITAGLFGFSPVLSAIAVGTVFYWPGLRVGLYAFVATVFTVVVQASLNELVEPLGIPTLTAPFVLVTWLFLLPKENFAPVPHAKTTGGAVKDLSQTR